MKLLFDENLSPSLVAALTDIYPQSVHVGDLGLKSSPDLIVWESAAKLGYIIVSHADFRQRSFLYGPPSKSDLDPIGELLDKADCNALSKTPQPN